MHPAQAVLARNLSGKQYSSVLYRTLDFKWQKFSSKQNKPVDNQADTKKYTQLLFIKTHSQPLRSPQLLNSNDVILKNLSMSSFLLFFAFFYMCYLQKFLDLTIKLPWAFHPSTFLLTQFPKNGPSRHCCPFQAQIITLTLSCQVYC